MARKRMISQDFLTSPDLAGSTVRLRLGFIGVLLFLDDDGRAQDDAEVIRAFVWPRDKVTAKQMEEDLAEMAARTIICRYEVDGKKYLHSPKWDVWQKVQHKSKSRIPTCDLHECLVKPSRETTETFTPNVVKSSSDQNRLDQVRGPDATSRAAKLAQRYRSQQPLADPYKLQTVIAQAIGPAGYDDDDVAAALDRLARDNRTVTQATLLVELNGQAKPSTTNSRVRTALDLAEKFAAKEAKIPPQRAIGGSA